MTFGELTLSLHQSMRSTIFWNPTTTELVVISHKHTAQRIYLSLCQIEEEARIFNEAVGIQVQ